MTTLPKSRTLLSLTKKGDILSLPGFEKLGHYLLKELKEFVRERMRQYTTKTRGFTVGEYIEIYNKDPKPYKPSKSTSRKNISPAVEKLLEEAKTYDATDWSHYGGSKKERKENIIKASKEAKAKKAAERKQRRKENKAKRAAQHQANWKKQRAEKEEAKLRDAEIKERMARKKLFENIKSNGKLIQSSNNIKKIKHDLELIKGKPVKIISIENNKK